MNNGIYVRIKRYATSEGTPENNYEDDGFADVKLKFVKLIKRRNEV